jgi:hypothetical protein
MRLRALVLVATLLCAVSYVLPGDAVGARPNTVVLVDSAGDVGSYDSLALDAAGHPVISYYDTTNGDLKVAHCGKPTCKGHTAIAQPDTGGNVGRGTSLALDASGNPVVSYFDATNTDLKVLHCGTPDCASGNMLTTPDTGFLAGEETSLVLDGSGNPVVAYLDAGNEDLKVLHCGDATCTSGNSTTSPDTGGIVGQDPSIALDASGNPVVSYFDFTNRDLKVLHCGDADCTSGNTIVAPDTVGSVGRYTSLALDASGNPVVSYYDDTDGFLKVLHCGSADCSSGNTIATPDASGTAGGFTSLRLDSSGNPVISYLSVVYPQGYPKLLHCGDATCTSGNSTSTLDTTGTGGEYTSLRLDSTGNPVVSYYDFVDGLKLAHCWNPKC